MALTSAHFVYQCVKPYRGWIAVQLLVATAVGFLRYLDPYVTKVLTDSLATTAPADAYLLTYILFLRLGVNLGWGIVFRLRAWTWLRIGPRLKHDMGERLMQRMLLHAHQLYQDHFTGGLANRIADVLRETPDLLQLCIDRFWPILLHLGVLTASLSLQVSPRYGMMMLAWVILFCMVNIASYGRAKRLYGQTAKEQHGLQGYVVDVLGNMGSVRLFGGHAQEECLLDERLGAVRRMEVNTGWYMMWRYLVQSFLFLCYQGACLYYLQQDFGRGEATPGDFIFILQSNAFLLMSLWSLADEVARALGMSRKITQGLQVALQPYQIQDVPGAKILEVCTGEITFDKVGFTYPGAEPLFQGNTITIHPGQKVGLVGYSGSGKSTFVNLLLRLFDVQEGRILVDGQDIATVTQASLRRALAVIPQESILFHRSIFENIAYARPLATREEVIVAAQRAGAHGFITALPAGYDTQVGERGTKLSGGQRQRIAIARAILKLQAQEEERPAILVLDEATSHLDPITEEVVQDGLWKEMQATITQTTLVIAHRLSTLQAMDRILVFDKGRVIQDGTHEELLAIQGLYKMLWEKQHGGFLGTSVA